MRLRLTPRVLLYAFSPLLFGQLTFASVSGADALSQSLRSSSLTRVWAIDDGEKVKQDDLSHPLAESPDNPVWDGSVVKLFGARNEVIAFQVILQAGSSPARGVDLEVTDLVDGEAVIPGSRAGSPDPFDYRGKSVELFTESYLDITRRSAGGNAWDPDAKPSDYYLGWVPDALIPFAAPPGLGGAPFTIPADKNQGVWVDIWVPRDASAGKYGGAIVVRESGLQTHVLPITLQVYDFTLPDETHLRNMFAIEVADVAERHGVNPSSSEYYAIEARYHQMAHRHRFDLVRTVDNLYHMKTYHQRYLTGSLYTSELGYEGPGEGVGNRTFSIGLYGGLPLEFGRERSQWSREKWWDGSDLWARWFQENAPQVEFHKFLFPDEPERASQMDAIRMQFEWTHSNPGPGSAVPAFVTHRIDPELQGHVDFWSVPAVETTKGWTDPVDVEAERIQGHKWGFYNGYRPATGTQVIDADAIEFRVIPWIAWKYEVDQYFYWMTTYYTDWPNGGKRTNVFLNPQTTRFSRNGAGTFFYPGQDRVFPEQDRSLPGPISSIRMKNWRRGAQDYEYLRLARELGLGQELETIVDASVPAALWEADLDQDISWSNHGYVFEGYRRQLAELIQRASGPNPAKSPASEDPGSPLAVDAGPDLTVAYPGTVELRGSATVLGGIVQPEGVPIRWARVSGPGVVVFGDPKAPETSVAFSAPGAYVLSLGAGEGLDWAEDRVVVDVLPRSGERAPTFLDVPEEHPYHGVIEAVYRIGYTAGCSAYPLRFCPDAPLSRAEGAVIILRALHGAGFSPDTPRAQVFNDVPSSSWAARWVGALWEQGLVAGCGEGPPRFCPDQALTRAEASVFFVRALFGSDYLPADPVGLFNDVPLGSWSARWAEAAYDAGLLRACGEEEGLRFCPDAPLTRAEAVSMLVRIQELR